MRISNWPSALIAHIEDNRQTPFKWGVHDCMLWAASCIEAVTDNDPAKDLRGTYSTALAAIRIIDSYGGFNALVESLIDGGEEMRIHRNLASRGDLVTTTDERGHKALGICDTHHGVFPGPDGLTFIKRNDLDDEAWRII